MKYDETFWKGPSLTSKQYCVNGSITQNADDSTCTVSLTKTQLFLIPSGITLSKVNLMKYLLNSLVLQGNENLSSACCEIPYIFV